MATGKANSLQSVKWTMVLAQGNTLILINANISLDVPPTSQLYSSLESITRKNAGIEEMLLLQVGLAN